MSQTAGPAVGAGAQGTLCTAAARLLIPGQMKGQGAAAPRAAAAIAAQAGQAAQPHSAAAPAAKQPPETLAANDGTVAAAGSVHHCPHAGCPARAAVGCQKLPVLVPLAVAALAQEAVAVLVAAVAFAATYQPMAVSASCYCRSCGVVPVDGHAQ